MAITQKGAKWERKNSLIFILLLFPFLNCIPFFHMSSRVKNKKWTLLGWLTVILTIVFISASIIFSEFYILRDTSTAPQLEDYLGYNYNDIYTYEEYVTADGYEQYKEDYYKWEHQPEILQAEEDRDRLNDLFSGLVMGSNAGLLIFGFIIIIIGFTDRPKYLQLLEQTENKNVVMNRMQQMTPQSAMQNTVPQNIASQPAMQNSVSQNIPPQTVTVQNNIRTAPSITGAVDINTANEQQLAALPGLTIIDAKKAIAHRNANGYFSTADDFFTVINAKPHIIIRAREYITVSTPEKNKPSNNNPSRRNIDL